MVVNRRRQVRVERPGVRGRIVDLDGGNCPGRSSAAQHVNAAVVGEHGCTVDRARRHRSDYVPHTCGDVVTIRSVDDSARSRPRLPAKDINVVRVVKRGGGILPRGRERVDLAPKVGPGIVPFHGGQHVVFVVQPANCVRPIQAVDRGAEVGTRYVQISDVLVVAKVVIVRQAFLGRLVAAQAAVQVHHTIGSLHDARRLKRFIGVRPRSPTRRGAAQLGDCRCRSTEHDEGIIWTDKCHHVGTGFRQVWPRAPHDRRKYFPAFQALHREPTPTLLNFGGPPPTLPAENFRKHPMPLSGLAAAESTDSAVGLRAKA